MSKNSLSKSYCHLIHRCINNCPIIDRAIPSATVQYSQEDLTKKCIETITYEKLCLLRNLLPKITEYV